MKKNLKEETLKKLSEYGLNWSDVAWISIKNKEVNKDVFLKLADKEYDNDYGDTRVNLYLIIMGADWWLERVEYDGSEYWTFKKIPMKPIEIENAPKIFVK